VLAILFGLSYKYIKDLINSQNDRKLVLMYVLNIAVVCQFFTLIYDPREVVPSVKDYEQKKEYLNKLSKIKGEVFDPFNTYVTRFAGKKSYAHEMLIYDVVRSNTAISSAFEKELKDCFSSGKFEGLILPCQYNGLGISESYYQAEIIYDGDGMKYLNANFADPFYIYLKIKPK